MLTDAEFIEHAKSFGCSDTQIEYYQQIRHGQPVRDVIGNAVSVTCLYSSPKMKRSIQAESHKLELPAVIGYENDPDVFEYYCQPAQLRVVFIRSDGKRSAIWYTPDYFVIHRDGIFFDEWKKRKDFEKLIEENPHRYMLNEDRKPIVPSCEIAAIEFGIQFRLRTDEEIDWILLQNMEVMEDYFLHECYPSSEENKNILISLVKNQEGITLKELISSLGKIPSDDIYTLVAHNELFIDLFDNPIYETQYVRVYSDFEMAKIYEATKLSRKERAKLAQVEIDINSRWRWNDQVWTILSLGKVIYLSTLDKKHVVEILEENFEELRGLKKITPIVDIAASPEDAEIRQEIRNILLRATKKKLQKALEKYYEILPVLEGEKRDSECESPARTIRDWVRKYSNAQKIYEYGFLGLIDNYDLCGDRSSKVPKGSEEIIQEFIKNSYETTTAKSITAVFGEILVACASRKVEAPSYETVRERINSRKGYDQTLKRRGRRAATQEEPWYWELSMTTPKHGHRALHILHFDHTEMDLELRHSETGKPMGKAWLSTIIDAFSRKKLVPLVLFDKPSHRTNMLLLRRLVELYGRLGQYTVMDGGADFRSTYVQVFIAMCKAHAKYRPKAKPRYGSVEERGIQTITTQLIHNLPGNTKIMKEGRIVTQSVDPKNLRDWTLPSIFERVQDYVDNHYNKTEHPATGLTPDEAFYGTLDTLGERSHRKLVVDEQFRILTLPEALESPLTIRKPGIVHSNYRDFSCNEMKNPTLFGTKAGFRNDPYNVGFGYIEIDGLWRECFSEHFAIFEGRTQKEVEIASQELIQRHRKTAQKFSVNAANLAQFLSSPENNEFLAKQREIDNEQRKALSLWDGSSKNDSQPKLQYSYSLPNTSSSSPEIDTNEENPWLDAGNDRTLGEF
jgi:putative transposase